MKVNKKSELKRKYKLLIIKGKKKEAEKVLKEIQKMPSKNVREYSKKELEDLDFKDLKLIGKKFGTTDRSMKRLNSRIAGKIRNNLVEIMGEKLSCINPEEINHYLGLWVNVKPTNEEEIKKFNVIFNIIHPFEDGNGRISRAVADMQLARADGSRERFYSMSVQIRQERDTYYRILEKTQKNTHTTKAGIDITVWLVWFLDCLNRGLEATENTLADVFKKALFWESHPAGSINERQRIMINALFDGFKGKLTSSKWAQISKRSQDTASRDILDLVEKGVLVKDPGGGRSTSYSLKDVLV